MRGSTSTPTPTCTAASTHMAERATAGYEGAREKVRHTSTRHRTARSSSRERDRGDPPHRVLLGPRQPRSPATSSSSLSSSTTRTSCPGFIAKRTGAQFAHIPIDDYRRAATRRARRDRNAREHQVVANNLVLEPARHDQPVEEARSLGARSRARSWLSMRRRGAAPAHRRAGARLATPRVLRRTSSVARAGVGRALGQARRPR